MKVKRALNLDEDFLTLASRILSFWERAIHKAKVEPLLDSLHTSIPPYHRELVHLIDYCLKCCTEGRFTRIMLSGRKR
jgi:hypothetical protein